MSKKLALLVLVLALGSFASAQVVLNQIPGAQAGSDTVMTSQDEPSASIFDTAVLEDFTVTAGQTNITKVEAVMGGFSGFTSFSQWSLVTSFRVEVYTSTAGTVLTGDTASQVVPAASATITNLNWNSFPHNGTAALVSLPVNINLPGAGTYYIAVIAVVDMGSSIVQVGVANNLSGSGGANATVINPGGGFGFGNSMNMGTDAAYRITTGTASATIVNPLSYVVVEGSEAVHDLPALLFSDDTRLTVGSNSANASMTILEYTTTAPAMTVNRVSFILEHQANDAGRSRQIDLWNYTTGQWETVSSTFCTTTDSTIKVDITVNPGRFINGANREMKARTRMFSITIPRTSPRIVDKFDRTVWELAP